MTPNTTAGRKTKEIINAWARIRNIDQTIPDDVLDFMKDAAIEKINNQFTASPPTVFVAIKEKIENRIKELKELSDKNTGLSLSVCLQIISELESVLKDIEQPKEIVLPEEDGTVGKMKDLLRRAAENLEMEYGEEDELVQDIRIVLKNNKSNSTI